MEKEVIIILVLFSIFSCMCSEKSNTIGNDYFSAKEGLETAKLAIKDYGENKIIIKISATRPIKSGKSNEWRFYFINQSDLGNIDEVNIILIKVYSEKSYKINFNTYCPRYDKCPINEFSIDSTDAYDIAINNEKIKTYLLKYDAEIGDFYMLNRDGNTYWKMYWDYNAGDEDYKRAEIHIDAINGEALYVEADE